MRIEGFRESLVGLRDIYVEWWPYLTKPEATALAVHGVLRDITPSAIKSHGEKEFVEEKARRLTLAEQSKALESAVDKLNFF